MEEVRLCGENGLAHRSLIRDNSGFAILIIMGSMIAIFIALGVALNYSYTIESQEVKLSQERMTSYWAMTGTLDYMLARCRQDNCTSVAAKNYQSELQLFQQEIDLAQDGNINIIKFKNPSNSLFLPLTVGISIVNSPSFSATVTSWSRASD
ncbi:MAG: hypothetical protein HQK99_12765 [Nitrospirae bacterium]|nr:hypothetical protein [Nitrospirota bacterium]